jgi:voltage-gated potassium channel
METADPLQAADQLLAEHVRHDNEVLEVVPWRQQAYERVEKATALPLLVLSIALVPLLVVPLVVRLSRSWQSTVDDLDLVVWAIFTLEYLTMLALAMSRWHYIKTHLLELLLVLLPLLRPLRILRSVRALRLLRIARLSTVATKGIRLSRTRLATRGPAYALGIAIILTLIASAVELDAERTKGNIKSFGDSVWWAMTTVTTVGYGDHYPVTSLGRVVAVVLMLLGISVLGIITAALAAWLVKVNGEPDAITEHREVLNRLSELEGLVLDLRADLARSRQATSGVGLQVIRSAGLSSTPADS